MIFVKRIEEPNSLLKNKEIWLKDYLSAIEEYLKNPTATNKRNKGIAENKYRQDDIKSALKRMFQEKCAYCESNLSHVSYGHIEHFKPKSTYPKKCFDWDNLLLGCEVCNGIQFKSVNFPLAADGGPLINPSIEDPTEFLNFEYDPETGLANVLGKNDRGLTTEKVLGLNRPELVRHRSRIVRMILFVAMKASEGDSLAIKEMRKLVKTDQEYSAFSIAISNKFGLFN